VHRLHRCDFGSQIYQTLAILVGYWLQAEHAGKKSDIVYTDAISDRATQFYLRGRFIVIFSAEN
jgi:hypothetical protein